MTTQKRSKEQLEKSVDNMLYQMQKYFPEGCEILAVRRDQDNLAFAQRKVANVTSVIKSGSYVRVNYIFEDGWESSMQSNPTSGGQGEAHLYKSTQEVIKDLDIVKI